MRKQSVNRRVEITGDTKRIIQKLRNGIERDWFLRKFTVRFPRKKRLKKLTVWTGRRGQPDVRNSKVRLE